MDIVEKKANQAHARFMRFFLKLPWREAEDVISQHGPVFRTPSGYLQQLPQVSISQQSQKTMHALAAEFGLTPACRTRIIAGGNAADAEDPMAKLLKGGWQDDV